MLEAFLLLLQNTRNTMDVVVRNSMMAKHQTTYMPAFLTGRTKIELLPLMRKTSLGKG